MSWPATHAALLRRRAQDIAAEVAHAPPARAARLRALLLRTLHEAAALVPVVIEPLRTCPRCRERRPASAFRPASPARAARGATREAYCRACEAAMRRARQGVAPRACARCHTAYYGNTALCEACRETHGRCYKCEQVKPLDAFSPPDARRAAMGARHAAACRACNSAATQARRAAKKEPRHAAD